jgi:hypothetical protein
MRETPDPRSQIGGTLKSSKKIYKAIGRLTFRAHRQDRVPEYQQPMTQGHIRAKIHGKPGIGQTSRV